MYTEISSALEAVLFASGEPVQVKRIAAVLGAAESDVYAAADTLSRGYEERGAGIRLVRLDKSLQLVSAAEHSDIVTRALEMRRPPKLSPMALEVLAVVAYFQPVTRAYIDNVRGVDSSYTVGSLLERGLIEVTGRLDVPGRPLLYGTSESFLRVMGLSELDELPELPELTTPDGADELQKRIAEMTAEPEQLQLFQDRDE